MPDLLSTLFIDPVRIGAMWYWLVVPLAVAIAVVYKALKAPAVRQVPVAAAGLTATILVGMAAAAAALYILYEVVF